MYVHAHAVCQTNNYRIDPNFQGLKFLEILIIKKIFNFEKLLLAIVTAACIG